MVLLSKYPIEAANVRSFQKVLWRDMPGALLPERPDGSPWYSTEALAVLRLSSKTHCDVPIRVGDRTLHALISHPTPRPSTAPRGGIAGATTTRSASGPTI